MAADDGLHVEHVPIGSLRAHPRNYQTHPPDQVEHIAAMIREHGVYRNILTARDLTILAGHGVVQGARLAGCTTVPIHRLDLDPDEPRALKILTGDNEVRHLAERDDRALSELLREVADTDIDGLLGTGFDSMMLAGLVYVTRPQSEIGSFDEAAEWAGMPSYAPADDGVNRVTVSFRNEQDRAQFARVLGLHLAAQAKSVWYPERARDDVASVRIVESRD